MTASHATTANAPPVAASSPRTGYRAHGNLALLAAGPRSLLLTSAQGKTPRGSDRWILALQAAVRQLALDGGVLIGSASPLPWDLALVLAADARVPVVLISPGLPVCPEAEYWRCAAYYGLDAQRFLLLIPEQGEPGKVGWQRRDALAWALAERVLPISVRPGGRLATGLSAIPETRLDHRWQVPYDPHPWTPPMDVPAGIAGEEQPSEWLVHWTRRTYAPWPDESMQSFCHAVIASTDRWCRDAPATLRHIVETGILRGSRFRSAGGAPVVSFTGATPAAMRANFRWSARKVAPIWEPWGIAIRREALFAMGGHPVVYGKGEGEEASSIPAWCRHGGGPFIGECEWRVHGDLHLADLAATDWQPVIPLEHISEEALQSNHALSWREWVSG